MENGIILKLYFFCRHKKKKKKLVDYMTITLIIKNLDSLVQQNLDFISDELYTLNM